MPLPDLTDIRLWNMPPTAGLPALNGVELLEIFADGFVTLATEQTITGEKTFDADIIIDNNNKLLWVQGGSNFDVLTLTAAGNIQIGVGVVPIDLAPSIGGVNILGPAGNNAFEIQARTGFSSVLRMAGTDITQPVTDFQPADVYYQLEPFSQALGGARITAINDADTRAFLIRSYIGVTNPTDTIPALEFRTGKSNGATGVSDLAAAETAYSFENATGSVTYFNIGGSGNVGIGESFDVGVALLLKGAGTDNVLRVRNAGAAIMFQSDTADLTVATGANAGDTMLIVNEDSTSNRSINASGTINASGADYAEYEKKKNVNDEIKKGDVVGFDENGLLTTKFSEAVSFGIKSTKPAYVGGDDWGSEKVVGDKPEKPHLVKPEYKGIEKPAGIPEPEEKATKAELDQYDIDKSVFNGKMKKYKADITDHNDVIEILKTDLEENQIPAYEAELETWKAKLETERVKVDRIAYAGKVPVNNLIGNAGDFVIPKVGINDVIALKSVSVENMTFKDYLIKVGQIHHLETSQTIVTISMG